MTEHLVKESQSFEDYAAGRRKDMHEQVMAVLQDSAAAKDTFGVVRMLALIAGELLVANLHSQRVYEDQLKARMAPCSDPNCQKPQCLQMRLMKKMEEQFKDGEEWRHE